MKKNVRIYFSTFIDVEVESDEFNDEAEMTDYVVYNNEEYLTDDNRIDEVFENLEVQPLETEVWDLED